MCDGQQRVKMLESICDFFVEPSMLLLSRVFLIGLALVSTAALPQEIAVSVTRAQVEGLARGQIALDLVARTRHPAYLEPQSLKTPDGIRIQSSVTSPDNARTCPRGGPSQSECRQAFRVILDTGPRCQAAGEYEALFRVACWPGTAASLCKPGAFQHNFKLPAEPLC